MWRWTVAAIFGWWTDIDWLNTTQAVSFCRSSLRTIPGTQVTTTVTSTTRAGWHLIAPDGGNHRIQVFEIVGGKPVYSTTIGTTGVSGTADGTFNYPNHLAFDSSGRLYVMDTFNYRVQRCTSAGGVWSCVTFFGEPGVSGSDPYHLAGWTNGIEIRNDVIYIADSNNQRVLKCNTVGVCAVFLGVTGDSGQDNIRLYSPSDVAVDSTGNIYVSEYDNHRVQKFNSSGTWLSRIGVTQVPYVPDTTRYNTPSGITVTADGSIYFVESWGRRLVKINASGVQQWAVGQAGVYGSDNAHFKEVWWEGVAGDVAVDAAGRVYVPDTGNDRIQIFDASTGAYTTTWGSSGSGPSQFSCPFGVTISPVNGDFYVADRCNNRVQVFDSNRVYKMQLGTGAYGYSNTQFADPLGVAVDKLGNRHYRH
jgi:tripartite motif-containing protein 71